MTKIKRKGCFLFLYSLALNINNTSGPIELPLYVGLNLFQVKMNIKLTLFVPISLTW